MDQTVTPVVESTSLSDFQQEFMGLHLLGRALSGDTAALPALLETLESPEQRHVAGALFVKRYGRAVSSQQEVATARLLLGQLQSTLRQRISSMISTGQRVAAMLFAEDKSFEAPNPHRHDSRFNHRPHFKKVLELQKLAHDQKTAKKPHTEGTVAELAEKLGLSKSEIRRLKNEGQLDAALAKHNRGASHG